MTAWPSTIAILGGGTMGAGIAEALSVSTDARVRLVDADPELTRAACARVVARARGHVQAGLLEEPAIERAGAVEGADGLEDAVAGADLVIEAVTESLDLKRTVYGTVSGAVPEQAVVASNTSSLPIAELAESVARPQRFLGMHWFNPPEWTPGIELVPTAATDGEVVERVASFLRAVGKRPIVVGDRAGFVANRLQSALFREALACVEEGIASADRIDEVVRSCFGFRLPFFGPFQIADMAGLDVYASVFETLERELGPQFAPPRALRELVERGRTGTKSGAGFLDYPDAERERLLAERDRRFAALGELLERLPPLTPAPPDDAAR